MKQQTMQAAVLDAFGGPDAIKIREVPIPAVGDNDVLIKVAAADIASWDAVEREGTWDGAFGLPSKFPYILGWSGSGTVAAVGKNVSNLHIDDRVYAASMPLPAGGFYAEYTAVPAEHVALIPRNLSMQQAGVLPWIGLTAASGIEALHLKPGESLVIIGASGGIGHIAIQLAKRAGVRVLAVVSGTEGEALARQLGADAIVDGRKEDVVAAARSFAPKGIDAALVTIGGEAAKDIVSILHDGSRIAAPNGVDPLPQLPQSVALHRFDGDRSQAALHHLNSLIESEPLEVRISQTFSLTDMAKAHRTLQTHPTGKLALEIKAVV